VGYRGRGYHGAKRGKGGEKDWGKQRFLSEPNTGERQAGSMNLVKA